MVWLTFGLCAGSALAVALIISYLLDRVQRLEQRLSHSSFELFQLVSRMETALLMSDTPLGAKGKAEDLQDAFEIIDRIGSRINKHNPALRRVLTFSVGIRLSYLKNRTGITSEDLAGLESQLAPEFIWPACSMTVEEWATHRVIRDYSGLRDVLYPGKYFEPIVLWKHEDRH